VLLLQRLSTGTRAKAPLLMALTVLKILLCRVNRQHPFALELYSHVLTGGKKFQN